MNSGQESCAITSFLGQRDGPRPLWLGRGCSGCHLSPGCCSSPLTSPQHSGSAAPDSSSKQWLQGCSDPTFADATQSALVSFHNAGGEELSCAPAEPTMFSGCLASSHLTFRSLAHTVLLPVALHAALGCVHSKSLRALLLYPYPFF